eukprot:2430367-Prymnesium_polylepis.1
MCIRDRNTSELRISFRRVTAVLVPSTSAIWDESLQRRIISCDSAKAWATSGGSFDVRALPLSRTSIVLGEDALRDGTRTAT